MQRIAAVMVLGGGLAFLMSQYGPSATDREEQVAAMTRIVARATIIEPETVPAELPGLRHPVTSPAAGIPQHAPPVSVATPVAAVEIETRAPQPPPAAAPPAGGDIQRRLAREIQSELKRVGCYSGRLDGSWGDRSRSAMATFIARVNASLPTTEPDVFLLSLIKGQKGEVCGPECGRTEVAVSGRCVARSVVASAGDEKPVTPAETKRISPPAVVPPVAVAAAPEPLPGRMSIGGPQPLTATAPPSAVAETLPWQAAPPPPAKQDFAAIEPDEPLPTSDFDAPRPPPRKVAKVKRPWVAAARPKPVKRRYSSSRSVQTLFMHPLGRM